jgi:hypothetical protein
VRGQLARVLRPPVRGQVGRRGAHALALHHQLACAQAFAFMAEKTAANGEVEAFGQHIDRPVAEAQEQFERWMLTCEFQEDRRDAMAAEQDRHGDAQTARHVVPAGLHLRLCGLQLRERAQAVFVIDLAVLGEALHARRAMKQAHVQARLQPRDRLAHGRAGEAQVRGGTGEAAQAHDVHEQGHAIEPLLAFRRRLCQIHWGIQIGGHGNALLHWIVFFYLVCLPKAPMGMQGNKDERGRRGSFPAAGLFADTRGFSHALHCTRVSRAGRSTTKTGAKTWHQRCLD